jgi:hypothetical protein
MKLAPLILLGLLCSAATVACERKDPTYMLRQSEGGDTFSHFDGQLDEDEQERKYIKVRRAEYHHERALLEARNAEQKKRNNHYFPRR